MGYKAAYIYDGSDWLNIGTSVQDSTQRTIANITGTTHTILASEGGKALVFSNSSAITLTVPNDTTYNFTIGQTFMIVQKGTGEVTVQGESPVSIRSLDSKVKTSGQYAEARLIKIAANEWLLSGDLTA